MIKNMSIKHRLILPIALLGIVAVISNFLAIINISNVNANAANISDNYMSGKDQLAQINHSILNIHKMALSHIVATDYHTMIAIVNQIKDEEALLDTMIEEYESYVTPGDRDTYEGLLSGYDSFKHALVHLVCASASHKTQEAYAYANGDVAAFGNTVESCIAELNVSISQQTSRARKHLMAVYIFSLAVGSASVIACAALVMAAVKLIARYVITPITAIMDTIKNSSERINIMVGEVLKRTRTSKGSAADLSSLAEELSATIQEVASNAAIINNNTKEIKQDVSDMAAECDTITAYTVEMEFRADEMEKSAQANIEKTRLKASDILVSLNQAIEQSQSVDQVNSLTNEILGISQRTRLIALNATVEAAISSNI